MVGAVVADEHPNLARMHKLEDGHDLAGLVDDVLPCPPPVAVLPPLDVGERAAAAARVFEPALQGEGDFGVLLLAELFKLGHLLSRDLEAWHGQMNPLSMSDFPLVFRQNRSPVFPQHCMRPSLAPTMAWRRRRTSRPTKQQPSAQRSAQRSLPAHSHLTCITQTRTHAPSLQRRGWQG